MTRIFLRQLTLITGASVALIAFPATAQLISNEAWRAPPSNRAQIAFSLKALKDGSNAVPGTLVNSTSIVCGGGATSATANSNCIILNEATGAIQTDQASDGDQDAATTDNSTNNSKRTEVDDLMDILDIQ